MGWMKKTARLMAADRLGLPSGCIIADSPVRDRAAAVEAGAGAKYVKAPGLRDVIQTVFGWTDSPLPCELWNPSARGIAAGGGCPTPRTNSVAHVTDAGLVHRLSLNNRATSLCPTPG